MTTKRDKCQYGNQKGLAVNHYLINMIHQILLSLDKNTNREKRSDILNMIDWSKTFERQSHILGTRSFIKNGVRPSLIPVLINFFQDGYIKVKWNNVFSSDQTVTGGGPQGGTKGILEYISQTSGNLALLSESEAFKFIDDASFIEVLNIASIGLSSINCRLQVPSDLSTDNSYLPTQNTTSQGILDKLNM